MFFGLTSITIKVGMGEAVYLGVHVHYLYVYYTQFFGANMHVHVVHSDAQIMY